MLLKMCVGFRIYDVFLYHLVFVLMLSEMLYVEMYYVEMYYAEMYYAEINCV